MIRLDKFLTEMGVGSRSEVKKDIKKGLVSVGGTVVKVPEYKFDKHHEEVRYKGGVIAYVQTEYYMLHKPGGVLSATRDPKCPTVVDLITDKKRKDLFPVGRLDKDTEGLLIITNDGDLAHKLLSPKKHVGKVYYAKIDDIVTEEDIQAFADGVRINEEFTALPAELKILSVDTAQHVTEIEVEIYEGKFHQIKRMFEARGKHVVYLKRLSMGPLALDPELPLGAFRPLTEEEIRLLTQLYE